jgi:hypothetical protein
MEDVQTPPPASDRMAAARAAKAARAEAAKAEAVRAPAKTIGRRISERARERAEEDAAMIPTTAEEYKRWERAVALLKATEPPVMARVIRTPVRMDPNSPTLVRNPNAEEEGQPEFINAPPRPLRDKVTGQPVHHPYLSISGDDLADSAPGSNSRGFRQGATVRLTAEAAERLSEQGWVELL